MIDTKTEQKVTTSHASNVRSNIETALKEGWLVKIIAPLEGCFDVVVIFERQVYIMERELND